MSINYYSRKRADVQSVQQRRESFSADWAGGGGSSGKSWRASLVGRLVRGFSSLMLAIFLLTFHVASYANNELFNGQILWVACNGDVTDQSGMNFPVENNGVTIVSDKVGKLGRACFFDGSDYLRVPRNPAFNLSTFTIAAWVLVEGTYNGEARAIVSNYDKRSGSVAGSYQHYGIGMGASGPASLFYDNGTGLGGAKDVGSSLATSEWHHVVGVFQGGNVAKLYVDGVLKRQSSGTMPTMISPTGDLFIGRGGSSELIEKKWVGSMDDVRIFNRALSGDEVTRLSGVIDLPTGETFTPLGTGENDPLLIEVKDGPITSAMVTPNADGSFSLNRVPTDSTGLRQGERGLPPETSTLIINNGEMTLVDEAEPGIVASLNIFGDLEVTDASIPDLKLILSRLDDRFAFLDPANPSTVARVNLDGTLEIIDETQPNVVVTYNNKDGSYMIVDNDAKTVTLADRKGNAVLSHPDAPGVAITFNLFDSSENYSIVDIATNECVEIISSGLRFSLKKIAKSALSAIGAGVKSAITTVANTATQTLINKVVTPFISGKLASGAAKLVGGALSAVSKFAGWFKCLPFLGKFAIVGGAVAIVGGVVAGIISFFKTKKKVKALEGQIQMLMATVQQQDQKIQQLEATVAGQAQTIQRLETTIEQLKQIIVQQAQVIQQQADEIAALRDTVRQQAEIIAKQAEMISALEKRIADLEARSTRAKEGVDEIPEGDPVVDATLRSKKSSGLRKSEPSVCIAVPEIPLIAMRNFNAELTDDKVIFTWQTLAELANTGFNIKCGQKNAAGEYTNVIQINDALIPTQGNGAEQHAYSYELPIQRPIGKTYRCSIESVDTDGKAFLFDRPGPVTLATLSHFTATPAEQSVLLQWKTDAELNSAGFDIWQAKPPADGQCQNKRVEDYQEITKLTERPIPAIGSRSQGASYSFEDNRVVPKTTYCYGLEEINEDGTSFIHWDWIATAVAR